MAKGMELSQAAENVAVLEERNNKLYEKTQTLKYKKAQFKTVLINP